MWCLRMACVPVLCYMWLYCMRSGTGRPPGAALVSLLSLVAGSNAFGRWLYVTTCYEVSPSVHGVSSMFLVVGRHTGQT